MVLLSRKLTKFRFFKNTPLIDFQNTIHFKSNQERDAFFLEGNHYPELQVQHEDFNFIRDRSTVDLNVSYDEMRGVNYCTFKSDFEDTRYYAYVVNYEYIGTYNDSEVVRVYLLIDGIMTFTQGNVLSNLPNLNIMRQHLPRDRYNNRIWELKNNDDVLKTSTKSYIEEREMIFDDLVIIIQSSADLRGGFGTEDDPKIRTSEGITFDNVSSPLELYVVEQQHFKEFMEKLNPFPWIAQNIRSMLIIPKDLIENRYQSVSTQSDFGFNHLHILRDGDHSNNATLNTNLQELSFTMNDLYELFDLDPEEDKHLLRSEYTTTELYTFNGQQLLLDNGLLNPRIGLRLRLTQVIGFHNEIYFYVDGYQTDTTIPTGEQANRFGSFLNNSISFDNFDDIPMLIDNYRLALANNANQRQLAEARQPTNRIQNIMDPNASLKDRFFDAASMISNFSISSMFGKFADEHEFYRNQQAEFADLALATPTITQQTHGNSLQIANGFFGLHQKFSAPSTHEMNEIKKYYKLFGYMTNDRGTYLADVHSMSICNYVQFEGSWTIPNVDVSLIEMMKAQFENGVRLWHNNNRPNPMTQDVLSNKMVI